MVHPAHNGGVSQRQAAFRHHLHRVAVAELEAQIPSHAQDDDLPVRVAAREQLPDPEARSSPHPQLIGRAENGRESELHQSPYFEVVAVARVARGTFLMRHALPEKTLKHEDAAATASRADGFTGPLTVRVEEKRQAPSRRLHGLPTLQKLCGSRFGWSAARTLEVAQELYDGEGKRLITYPRAESRYLPENPLRAGSPSHHGNPAERKHTRNLARMPG
jgi:DNA topoisomerase